MAVTIIPLGLAGASADVDDKIIRDTDSDGTAEQNVADGATSLYVAHFDNAANGAASYAKFYNLAAPTVGTSEPELIIPLPASGRRTLVCNEGHRFTVALSVASVTAGGTAGTTGPTSDVAIDLSVGDAI